MPQWACFRCCIRVVLCTVNVHVLMTIAFDVVVVVRFPKNDDSIARPIVNYFIPSCSSTDPHDVNYHTMYLFHFPIIFALYLTLKRYLLSSVPLYLSVLYINKHGFMLREALKFICKSMAKQLKLIHQHCIELLLIHWAAHSEWASRLTLYFFLSLSISLL